MQGLWKEQIGGWNAKDIKRKKQSRKHTLKDKGRALLKVYDGWYNSTDTKEDENIFREEGSVLWESETPEFKRQTTIEVCKVLVDDYDYSKYDWWKDLPPEGYFQGKSRIAYEFRGTWYDYFDDTEISGLVKVYSIMDVEGIIDETEEPIPKYRKRSYWNRHNTGGTDFLYNKPLPGWLRNTFYSDGKRRKIGQKLAHSADRAAVRTYIENEDWDAEIASGPLSKSISWFVS